ncbi:MAG: hypothetical protein LBI67_00995 [Treponema sp.]|jgi:hypothetical protein|nr:hypothetical protein [Treponema sp.]
MKIKRIFFVVLFFLVVSSVFGDSPAGHLIGFSETDGYCIVEGYGRLHYWLYDTYSWHDGDGRQLTRAFLTYVERLGWTVDYDNYRHVAPNNELAQSVRRMMSGKNSDVSMTIIEHNRKSATLVINNYDATNGYWWSGFYPLIR